MAHPNIIQVLSLICAEKVMGFIWLRALPCGYGVAAGFLYDAATILKPSKGKTPNLYLENWTLTLIAKVCHCQ